MSLSCDPQRSPWLNLFLPLKTSVTTIFVSLLASPFFPFFPPCLSPYLLSNCYRRKWQRNQKERSMQSKLALGDRLCWRCQSLTPVDPAASAGDIMQIASIWQSWLRGMRVLGGQRGIQRLDVLDLWPYLFGKGEVLGVKEQRKRVHQINLFPGGLRTKILMVDKQKSFWFGF